MAQFERPAIQATIKLDLTAMGQLEPRPEPQAPAEGCKRTRRLPGGSRRKNSVSSSIDCKMNPDIIRSRLSSGAGSRNLSLRDRENMDTICTNTKFSSTSTSRRVANSKNNRSLALVMALVVLVAYIESSHCLRMNDFGVEQTFANQGVKLVEQANLSKGDPANLKSVPSSPVQAASTSSAPGNTGASTPSSSSVDMIGQSTTVAPSVHSATSLSRPVETQLIAPGSQGSGADHMLAEASKKKKKMMKKKKKMEKKHKEWKKGKKHKKKKYESKKKKGGSSKKKKGKLHTRAILWTLTDSSLIIHTSLISEQVKRRRKNGVWRRKDTKRKEISRKRSEYMSPVV